MRRRKPSKVWSYNSAEISTMELSPVKYYMEDTLQIEDIEPLLLDATINDFIELYKQYHQNYFKYYSKLNFFAGDTRFTKVILLFNDDFFTTFKEDKYYVRRSSLKTLSSFLVEAHYPNKISYKKAFDYVEGFSNNFNEGRMLVSFNFHLVKNDI
jgi:hypothetical protein